MTEPAQTVLKPGETESPDLQGLLPTQLRSRWCVVPRFELYQVFGVGALFGAGLSLMIAGFILHNVYLRWAWPLALLSIALQRFLLGRTATKYESEAQQYQSSE